MGVYAQLVPGKGVRKTRRMGLNHYCCFTDGVGRKRVTGEKEVGIAM